MFDLGQITSFQKNDFQLCEDIACQILVGFFLFGKKNSFLNFFFPKSPASPSSDPSSVSNEHLVRGSFFRPTPYISWVCHGMSGVEEKINVGVSKLNCPKCSLMHIAPLKCNYSIDLNRDIIFLTAERKCRPDLVPLLLFPPLLLSTRQT